MHIWMVQGTTMQCWKIRFIPRCRRRQVNDEVVDAVRGLVSTDLLGTLDLSRNLDLYVDFDFLNGGTLDDNEDPNPDIMVCAVNEADYVPYTKVLGTLDLFRYLDGERSRSDLALIPSE